MMADNNQNDDKHNAVDDATNPFSFIPNDDDNNSRNWTLLSQGAEARVWKHTANAVVCKERFPKLYRHPSLDVKLTKSRCRMEAKILQKCAAATIAEVPKVLRVENALIYMEFITGQSVRQVLEEPPEGFDTLVLAKRIGTTLAALHNHGIVHGDLTSSNMMLRSTSADTTAHSNDDDVILIDFGLAKNSQSTEDKAVDLYVLERALTSTHPNIGPQFWETLLDVYGKLQTTNGSSNKKQDTLARLEQVRQRGRKRECFG